jgi:hypothetical protein
MTTYHRPLKGLARRTEYAGRVYASKMEANRAAELDLLVRAGAVAWWLPQVTIPLGPDHKMRVDFLVAERAKFGAAASALDALFVHAEDVKGARTREHARHERLWRKYGPFELRIITKTGIEIIEREA